jgi:hypothetical protein
MINLRKALPPLPSQRHEQRVGESGMALCSARWRMERHEHCAAVFDPEG